MSAHCCQTPAAPPACRSRLPQGAVDRAGASTRMFLVEIGRRGRPARCRCWRTRSTSSATRPTTRCRLPCWAWRCRCARSAALLKAACMAAFGVFVLGKALWNLHAGAVPEPATMGAVGFAALAANAGVALMLYRYRTGDANMRSVWICSRNDALGNVAVMLCGARRVRHRQCVAGPGRRRRDGFAGAVGCRNGAGARARRVARCGHASPLSATPVGARTSIVRIAAQPDQGTSASTAIFASSLRPPQLEESVDMKRTTNCRAAAGKCVSR